MLLLLALVALPRVFLASTEHGTNHPDEIFQMLEPAHRWVYGFGIQSWEFRDGARSWLLPGALALLWKMLAWLGLSSPLLVVPILRMPFVALAVYSAYLAARLAGKWAGETAAMLALAFAAFAPLALLLDFRTTTEAASVPFVLLALLSLADRKPARAGAFLALLVFLRPTNGIVGLTAAAWLLVERRFREAARLALGALPVAVAGGLLDWATWGSPFHHLVEYARFNWLESGASLFGSEQAWFFGLVLLSTAPVVALLLLPGTIALLRKQREARTALAVAWVYLLFHSIVGHKEPRFLLPILALLSGLSAAGIVLWVGPWFRKRVTTAPARDTLLVATAAALLAFGMLRARGFTYGDLWEPRGEANDHVLFGKRAAVNRMLAKAGDDPNLCGMLIMGLMPNELFSGGMTYLHRDVILASPHDRQAWPMASQAANYAIAPARVVPPGWHRVAQLDEVALVSRPGDCLVVPEQYRQTYLRPHR